MLAVGFFVVTDTALCNLHITFEGLCYCQLRLPKLVINNAHTVTLINQ